MDILDDYNVRVSRIILLCVIVIDIIGFTHMNILTIMGNIQSISRGILILIDIFILFPQILILILEFIHVVDNEQLNRKVFRNIKKTIIGILIVNYYIFNFTFKSGELWQLIFLFAALQALFLDFKLTVVLNVFLIISLPIVCYYKPNERPRSDLFWQDMSIRINVSVLIMIIITVLVYCSGKILLNLKKEKEKYLIQYLKDMEENQAEIREMKHNLNNEILVLKSIIDERNLEYADEFINKMINNTKKLDKEIYTENIVINSIINSKIEKSIIYSVTWDVDINIPKEINIDDSDIAIILGNILDNAIEACSFINDEERKIKVNIEKILNNIVINIENTKNTFSCNKEGTWKKDKINHGIGLVSVKKLVEKYNGAINNKDKGNLYEVNIILWN